MAVCSSAEVLRRRRSTPRPPSSLWRRTCEGAGRDSINVSLKVRSERAAARWLGIHRRRSAVCEAWHPPLSSPKIEGAGPCASTGPTKRNRSSHVSLLLLVWAWDVVVAPLSAFICNASSFPPTFSRPFIHSFIHSFTHYAAFTRTYGAFPSLFSRLTCKTCCGVIGSHLSVHAMVWVKTPKCGRCCPWPPSPRGRPGS